MLFLQYLLMAIGAFVVLRVIAGIVSRVADSYRFMSLVRWLELDRLEVAKRFHSDGLPGLIRDVHVKLRERQTLLMFRIERTATAARDSGDSPRRRRKTS